MSGHSRNATNRNTFLNRPAPCLRPDGTPLKRSLNPALCVVQKAQRASAIAPLLDLYPSHLISPTDVADYAVRSVDEPGSVCKNHACPATTTTLAECGQLKSAAKRPVPPFLQSPTLTEEPWFYSAQENGQLHHPAWARGFNLRN